MASMNDFMHEHKKIVQVLAPVDISGGKTSLYVALKTAEYVEFIVHIGAHSRVSTITVKAANDNAGTDADAIAFNYRVASAPFDTSHDSLGALTAATSSGVATDGASANICYVIPIRAAEIFSQLPDDPEKSPYVCVSFSDPGGTGDIMGVTAVLGGLRYAQNVPPAVTA